MRQRGQWEQEPGGGTAQTLYFIPRVTDITDEIQSEAEGMQMGRLGEGLLQSPSRSRGGLDWHSDSGEGEKGPDWRGPQEEIW